MTPEIVSVEEESSGRVMSMLPSFAVIESEGELIEESVMNPESRAMEKEDVLVMCDRERSP